MQRDQVLRKILKSLNGSIEVLSNLERDPPIIEIANLERTGEFETNGLYDLREEVMKTATSLNEYRRDYWKLELTVRQAFIDILKKKRYLPGFSLEIESLKNALPEALIKGDPRIWVYSLDHYMPSIAGKVGRPVKDAPAGNDIWSTLESIFEKRINGLMRKANMILPEIHHLKGRIRLMIGHPGMNLGETRIKRAKITPVSRPIEKIIVIKRPIPLPKKMKRPRKRVLKKPDLHTIGPRDE